MWDNSQTHHRFYLNDMIFVYLRSKKISPSGKCHLWYVHSIKYCGFFSVAEAEKINLFLSLGLQVKMGTERGSMVVKGAVLTLYSLLFGLGLCKALPLTCIVSKSLKLI